MVNMRSFSLIVICVCSLSFSLSISPFFLTENSTTQGNICPNFSSSIFLNLAYPSTRMDEKNWTNVLQETFINIIDKPKDTTGDGISDIGYVNGNNDTSFSFIIQVLAKNATSNEMDPISNGTVRLTITLWDDRGGRYINTTSVRTSAIGLAVFNYTGFKSDRGIHINDYGLGASGKVHFRYVGETTNINSTEELDIEYIARPIPHSDPIIWGSFMSNSCLNLLTIAGVSILIAIIFVIYIVFKYPKHK